MTLSQVRDTWRFARRPVNASFKVRLVNRKVLGTAPPRRSFCPEVENQGNKYYEKEQEHVCLRLTRVSYLHINGLSATGST
ncbi:hypothetical protein EVAR_38205_1 [Eumeta japonica]|uniref:Uncharacterized protein n=1 Tax=Eumeta variegata TaxID=151549 RepID=A0A4C1WH35_EUMVA|nr:hypothetical protein EVAR_38205_1 [Eumeta japonica]